jgi:hypothetical protein
MSQDTTATTTAAKRHDRPSERDATRRPGAHDGVGATPLKGFALVPLYVWDDLEPAELRRRSEWHDPEQPRSAPG